MTVSLATLVFTGLAGGVAGLLADAVKIAAQSTPPEEHS
jgi:hypothetical protein